MATGVFTVFIIEAKVDAIIGDINAITEGVIECQAANSLQVT